MSRTRKLGALVVTALVALTAATAGVGTAVATAATPAAAANVDGCTVIDEPGSYEFTGDIATNESGPCIEIRADDVHLDGNGYFLSQTGPYPDESHTDGVYVNGTNRSVSNVTVTNATIENWRLGVYYEETSGGTVSDVRSLGNLYGVRTLLSENVTVEDSEVRYNSLGFTDRRSENLTYRSNVAVENKWGFHFEAESLNHTLVDNYAANNSKNGFHQKGTEQLANHRVENLTLGERDVRTTVDFEGGRSVALSPTAADPAAPANRTAVGANVELKMTEGGGTNLDTFSVHYPNAADVNESTLTLWQHDGESWTEFDDPTSVDPAANAVTAEGIITSSVVDGEVVVAPLGEPYDGPDAALAADPVTADANVTNVTLDASASTARDDAEYRWDVDGDGEVETTTVNATTTHAYATTGEYAATVTVVDGEYEDAATATVNVTDRTAPTAAVTLPASVEAGETLIANASASEDNAGIATYDWEFGGNATATGVTAEHTYADAGEHAVTLTVTDGAGNADAVTENVTVVERTDDADGGGNEGDDGSDGSDDTDDTDDADDGNDDDADGGNGAPPGNTGGGQPVGGDDGADDSDDGGDGDDETAADPSMTVDVTSTATGVAATVENGTADESFAVPLSEYGVGTEAVAFGNLSAALAADANGTLTVSANDTSPLATDAGTTGFDPAAYLAIDGNLSDDAVANASVEFVASDRLDADAVAVKVNRGDGWERVGTSDAGVARNGTATNVTADGPAVFAVGVDRPSLAVTDLATNESTVEPGDAVAAEATVTNHGAAEGTETATLLVGGEARNATEVTVPANDTATVTFRPRFEAAGNYTLAVGGATETVSVESAESDGGGEATTVARSTTEPTTGTEDDDAEEASTTGQPGFGLAAALVALLGAALLALRRRR